MVFIYCKEFPDKQKRDRGDYFNVLIIQKKGGGIGRILTLLFTFFGVEFLS